MHEESKVLESDGVIGGAASIPDPSLPKVIAAREDLVAYLRSMLPAQTIPLAGNLARRAAMSAIALARHPMRHASVTTAVWPRLQVPTVEANWRVQQPAPLLSQAPDWRASDQTVARSPDADTSALMVSSVVPDESDAIADGEMPDKHQAFSFRPGDRDVPRLSFGQVPLQAGGAALFQAGAVPIEHREARGDRGASEIQSKSSRSAKRSTLGFYLRKAAWWTTIAFAAWFGLMLGLIGLFRFVDPPGSTLMWWQALAGTKIEQRWVPLTRISNNLKRAVVVSEDGRFCHHWGVDPREVLAAIRRARDGVPRGASTITMQVSKNLFLWPSKNYLRKALEVPLTFGLELLWPKSRILEVYLNIAEWGPGVFGAEAAARYHFGKSASRLSSREAALLAVALPNPIARRAGRPGPGTARLASLIQSRVRAAGDAAACVLQSR